MTELEKYYEIHESIINGQFKQAAAQMRGNADEPGVDVCDFIDYLADNWGMEIALKAAKVYIRNS